ncbi:hypothetical protein DERF_003450 [Dermatophagoides farinae]|uniref:Uncharacterized protein n=1 Tax=Dermatophagoides farinae TaxID=6954 RepID=A0A922IER1_DERFA|nr:hypothetical protein DERF_003450 [Dermatophagoides farinae]
MTDNIAMNNDLWSLIIDRSGIETTNIQSLLQRVQKSKKNTTKFSVMLMLLSSFFFPKYSSYISEIQKPNDNGNGQFDKDLNDHYRKC